MGFGTFGLIWEKIQDLSGLDFLDIIRMFMVTNYGYSFCTQIEFNFLLIGCFLGAKWIFI
jgi:hypothetical protein